MKPVDMWELVRDWAHEHYEHVRVTKFESTSTTFPTTHLGQITLVVPGEEVVEIGFVAPKGVLLWNPLDLKNVRRKFDYIMYPSGDPQLFEKIEETLKLYELKRSK